MNGSSIQSLFVINGVVSVAMMLLNKTISSAFPFPVTIVAIQNLLALVGTLLIILVKPSLIGPVRRSHVAKSIPGTMIFSVALTLAMMSARLTSIPVASVCSNCRPLTTSLIEFLIAGASLGRGKIFGLAWVATGSLVTAKSVGELEFQGMQIALIYVLLTSLQSAMDNRVMKSVKSEQTALGINLYRLTLSTPILIVTAIYSEGLFSIHFPARTVLLLCMTGISCLVAGVVVFRLQALTSATSIQVANIGFKLVTTGTSLFTHHEMPNLFGWIGFVLSMVGIVRYTLY